LSGNLGGFDLDQDEEVKEFLALNPHLEASLRTKGERGCTIHLYLEGDYPNKKAYYTLRNAQGEKIGEFRCGGGELGAYTVIWGRHPHGMRYRRLVSNPPVRCDWSSIQFPWPVWWEEPEAKPVSHGTRVSFSAPVRSPDLDCRIRAYIDKVDRAIQGQHGSDPTFRLANVLVDDWACDREEAIRYLHYYSQTRCEPPWSDKEIEHKVDDAFKNLEKKGGVPSGLLAQELVSEQDIDDFLEELSGENSRNSTRRKTTFRARRCEAF
jgi:hypothetical protein